MSVVYKCKECGGQIEPQVNGLGKCLYCGALQTLPKDKDDAIQNLLNRANDFRLNCDFDRAIFEYEAVLKLSETEPEAHWGLFLSRYGVEYVKDTMTLAYKPTLHRISSKSVFEDLDYKATIKYADPISAMQYKKDAENIEMVMKEFLLLSTHQDPYDVFLSYKELDDTTRQQTEDHNLAYDLYNELTARGYKVFFAPKSLGVGQYEPKIYSAIISSKVMIVLGTKAQYFDAVWVKNEWSRFAELIENGEKKALVPVFKGMEAKQLPTKLAKYQALDMSNINFLSTLTEIIQEFSSSKKQVTFDKESSAENANLERGFLALEDRDFSRADSFFENVLNLNPHNSQAYFGKLMVEMRVTKQEQILTSTKPLSDYSNFEKAVRFADQQLKTTLLQYEKTVQNSLNQQEYNRLVKQLDTVSTSEQWKGLGDQFHKISFVNNSSELSEKCQKKAKLLDEITTINQSIVRDQEQVSKLVSEKNSFGGSIIFSFIGSCFEGLGCFCWILAGLSTLGWGYIILNWIFDWTGRRDDYSSFFEYLIPEDTFTWIIQIILSILPGLIILGIIEFVVRYIIERIIKMFKKYPSKIKKLKAKISAETKQLESLQAEINDITF